MKKMNLKSTVLMSVAGLMMSTSAFAANCDLDYSKSPSDRLQEIKFINEIDNNMDLKAAAKKLQAPNEMLIAKLGSAEDQKQIGLMQIDECSIKKAALLAKKHNGSGVIWEIGSLQFSPTWGARYQAGVSLGISLGFYASLDPNLKGFKSLQFIPVAVGKIGAALAISGAKNEALSAKTSFATSGYVVFDHSDDSKTGSIFYNAKQSKRPVFAGIEGDLDMGAKTIGLGAYSSIGAKTRNTLISASIKKDAGEQKRLLTAKPQFLFFYNLNEVVTIHWDQIFPSPSDLF